MGERAYGRLLQGGQVVVPALEATFEVGQGPDGREAWSGELEVPGPALELEMDGSYQLILKDGRTAAVRVRRVRTSLSAMLPTRVNFEGVPAPSAG